MAHTSFHCQGLYFIFVLIWFVFTLNVVVEHAVVISVFVEKLISIVRGKVFKLYKAIIAVFGYHGIHKLVEELLIYLTSGAPLPLFFFI